jgi:hypothetical protein
LNTFVACFILCIQMHLNKIRSHYSSFKTELDILI